MGHIDVERVWAVGTASITEVGAGPISVPMAMIDWVDAKGFKHHVPFEGGGSGLRNLAGKQIPVLFDPTNPTRARVASFQSLWMFAALLAGSD